MKRWSFIGFVLLAAMGAAAGDALSVRSLMERLATVHARLQENLLREGPREAWVSDLSTMEDLYARLEGAYRPYYGGDEESWRSYCSRSRSALETSKDLREGGDLPGARKAFFVLSTLREQAHEEFNPGFFKRLFRKKIKEKTK